MTHEEDDAPEWFDFHLGGAPEPVDSDYDQ